MTSTRPVEPSPSPLTDEDPSSTEGKALELEPERLRSLCWELGTRFPPTLGGDRLALAMVHQHLGFLHWQLRSGSVEQLKADKGAAFDGARLALRVYDVTDIDFDGFNAHSFFDIGVDGLSGTHSFHVGQLERNLLAEIGFALPGGEYCALARSRTCLFDRDQPASRFSLRGLYVARDYRRVFPVENVLDAPVFERLARDLSQVERQTPIHVALLHLGFGGRLQQLLDRFTERAPALSLVAERFGSRDVQPPSDIDVLVDWAESQAEPLAEQIVAAHTESHFELLHCHDWSAIPAALEAAERLDLPLVLSLHSTEIDRAGGAPGATQIREWERRGIQRAELSLVPHSYLRQQLVTRYDAEGERVLIVPNVYEEPEADLPDPGEYKQSIGLHPAWPVALFAGEISHAAGADLLVDALCNVCREHGEAQFVFAGEGPLRGELEGRVDGAGFGHRCRFLGDVDGDTFDNILLASDFVCIPARTWQDEGLAQLATSRGKPVLTTHQAQVHCIVHGENGLVTYDNPGSIVWGVKELLANPLQGNILRLVVKQKAQHTQSFESSVAEHYLAYARALARWEEQ